MNVIELTRLDCNAGFLFVLVAMAMLFGVLSSKAQNTWYWIGSVDHDWTNQNNFQESDSNLPGLPQNGDDVYEESWAVQPPFINNNSGKAPILNAVFFSSGVTVTNGGELDTIYFKLGWDGSGTLNVCGGTVSAINHLDVGGYNGGTATLNVSAGNINAGGFYLNLNGTNVGASQVNLTGGTINEMGPLSINTSHSCQINIAGGMLILPSNQSGNVTYWINNRQIVGYGGSGTVNVNNTSNPGNLVLTATPTSTWYWNGDVSQDWTNPNNFQSQGSNTPGVPMAGNTVYLESWARTGAVINSDGNAPLTAVYEDKNMRIKNGGELDTTFFKLADSASATLSVDGGVLWATNSLDVGGYAGGTAIMNVSGGTANIGALLLNENGDTNVTVGGSQLYLTGGTCLGVNSLSINESHPAVLDIDGGTLVLPANQLGNTLFWINDGAISAYGLASTTNSFNIDQMTSPGNLLITAVDPGFSLPTYPQWNPEVISNLPPTLDQAMPLVPPGLAIVTNADYSFGSTVATNGEVYFTEYGNNRIQKFNTASGTLSTVVSGRTGLFGIAVDNAGNLFYAQDFGTSGGVVVCRKPDGSEQNIITNVFAPREVSLDATGNVYVASEVGEIIKWTRSSAATTVINTPEVCEGVAIGPDGRIYFCTYGRGGGEGTMLTQGGVFVVETNGAIAPIAGGFGRCRGMAFAPDGSIYVAAESSVWDDGNSGVIEHISTNGTATNVLSGLDYPQFPSVASDYKVYFTLARDNELVAYDPNNSFSLQKVAQPDLTLTAQGANWEAVAGANYPFQLKLTDPGNPSDSLTILGYLKVPTGNNQVNMWWNVPVTNLDITLAQLPNAAGNTNSGLYQLPAVSVNWAYGAASASVIPLREHQGCRWPMTNINNAAIIAAAPGFAETPLSYLVYVGLGVAAGRPLLTIQPWTGNKVRLSWPVAAMGYTLQCSTTVNSGYATSGLNVSQEGANNAAYDSLGSGARYYELTK